jgi:hypothetical protein
VISIPLPPGVHPEATPCPDGWHKWADHGALATAIANGTVKDFPRSKGAVCGTCNGVGSLLSVRVVVDELPTVREVLDVDDGWVPARGLWHSSFPHERRERPLCDGDTVTVAAESGRWSGTVRDVTNEPWAVDARPGRYLLVIEDMTEVPNG